jgi:hypothetical protein
MTTNLSAPENKELYQVEQYKRLASLWVHEMRIKKITHEKVESRVISLPKDQQSAVRHWLDYYLGLSGPLIAQAQTKPRALPPLWLENRQRLKMKNRPYAKQ